MLVEKNVLSQHHAIASDWTFLRTTYLLPDIADHALTVETARFGPFTFRVGVETPSIETLFLRVSDAHRRLQGSPLAQVASRLEREIVATSIFGTNSIEGGTLSEEETQLTLDLDPSGVQDTERRRVINIKAAYDFARAAVAAPDWDLDRFFIQHVHSAITQDIPHDRNRPGVLRENPKGISTHVGDQAHGGRYKPPQFGGDVRLLLDALLHWHHELVELGVPVLIRAPLVHFYYELIHPFWDGNGRVGRVIEASLLLREGFRYAPFAQARFYLDQIDRYFNLFNSCRKAADKGTPNPNTAFALFFLEGMLTSLDTLHDRVNRLVHILLFENDLKRRHDEKQINARQYAIATQAVAAAGPIALADLRRAPWYLGLYAQRTDKTKQRDLSRLRELGLVILDKNGRVWPGFMQRDADRDRRRS
jgi:Fic family protein